METIKKRQQDATSKETVEDLQDESALDTDDTDEKNDGPSPDGAFDEPDEREQADPL